MSDSKVSYTGPGFLTLLGLLFIGLKLGGIIGWSWWWVLLPIYGQVLIVLIALILVAALVD